MRHKREAFAVVAFAVPVFLSVFFGLAALDKRDAGMAYEILNTIDVLDVRTPVEDLKITFRGEDIQQGNLNLRIYSIRVMNTGETDILQSHYDSNEVWGLQVSDGKVIEARPTISSSDYLSRKAIPGLIGDDLVEFPKTILEEGEFFAFDMLVLHVKGQTPVISPRGKIAGIDEISMSRIPLETEEPSFVSELFSGGWLIQMTRIPLYFLGTLLVVVAGVVIIIFVSEDLPKRIRRLKASMAPALRNHGDATQREALKEAYGRWGTEGLKALKGMLDAPETIPKRGGPSVQLVEEFNISFRHLEEIGAVTRGPAGEHVLDAGFRETLERLMAELGVPSGKDQELPDADV
jgi:hypothetical protein